MKEKKMHNMTVRVEDGLYRLFKSKCAIEDVSMNSVLVQAMRDYLADEIKDPESDNRRVFDDMTVTDSIMVNLNGAKEEEKSWIKRKLSL